MVHVTFSKFNLEQVYLIKGALSKQIIYIYVSYLLFFSQPMSH